MMAPAMCGRACHARGSPFRHAETSAPPAAVHELAVVAPGIHRLQRAAGNRAMARLLRSAEGAPGPAAGSKSAAVAPPMIAADQDCAQYEGDEVRTSHTQGGHLASDVFVPGPMSAIGRAGDIVIADFGVDWGSVKDSTAADPLLRLWIATFESDPDYWLEIEGYSDCVGAERRNEELRRRRATKVFQLFEKARLRVRFHKAAPASEYLTDNQDARARATNRAATIRFGRDVSIPGELIEVPVKKPPAPAPPPPAPPTPDTVDCDVPNRDALARALPLAVEMTRAALGAIEELTPESEALLKKYFGPDAVAHRYHVKQNFASILDGLKWGPTFECEEAGSWWCDGAYARVLPIVGLNIHICPSAIARGDDFLARTLIHEAAHGFAFEFGEEICEGGCPPDMETEDAESNADSYGEFGGDALKLP
jgi:hypothetical protein